MRLADHCVIQVVWQAGETYGYCDYRLPLEVMRYPLAALKHIAWVMQREAEDAGAPVQALQWECLGRPYIFESDET